MFQGLNLLPILAAVVADMVVGSLWYSPFLFGSYWMKEMGLKKEDIKGASKAMAFAVVSSLVMAVVLSMVLRALNVTTIDGAIETAFMLWVGFVATTNSMKIIYERGKPSVYFLQVAYHLIAMIIMSIILVSWR